MISPHYAQLSGRWWIIRIVWLHSQKPVDSNKKWWNNFRSHKLNMWPSHVVLGREGKGSMTTIETFLSIFVQGLWKKGSKVRKSYPTQNKINKAQWRGSQKGDGVSHEVIRNVVHCPQPDSGPFYESFFKWEKSIFISFRSSLSATKLSYPLALPS